MPPHWPDGPGRSRLKHHEVTDAFDVEHTDTGTAVTALVYGEKVPAGGEEAIGVAHQLHPILWEARNG